jgi:hypothetical protein
MLRKSVAVLAIAMVSMLAASPVAYAYVDPGAVSYLLQAAFGALAAAAAGIVWYWTQLKTCVLRLIGRAAPADASRETPTQEPRGDGLP